MKGILIAVGRLFLSIFKNHPIEVHKFRYWKYFKRKLNLNNPKLFYDKIVWLSLFTDTSQWSSLADKYAVRDYVKNKVSSDLLNELYGLYENVEEINYEQLPNSFVMKTTHGCANNVLVKDKFLLDKKATNKKMKKWLKFPFGELTGQLHHARIKPMVIVEKLLLQDGDPDKSLIDYKFYCFYGAAKYIHVLCDREFGSHNICQQMYDMDWIPHSEYFNPKGVHKTKNLPPPKSFALMKEYAEKLAAPFPFVRVDLYEIDGKPIFGEMTFLPGTDPDYTLEFQEHLGELIGDIQHLRN